MWMQKSVEGSSFSSSGNFHDRNRFGSPYAQGGNSYSGGAAATAGAGDWKSKILESGQWLGGKVIEYGGKLARGPNADAIPDQYAQQMPRNDGRANWMADIRSSSSSYSGGGNAPSSYSGGGYQNDFATERPKAYSEYSGGYGGSSGPKPYGGYEPKDVSSSEHHHHGKSRHAKKKIEAKKSKKSRKSKKKQQSDSESDSESESEEELSISESSETESPDERRHKGKAKKKSKAKKHSGFYSEESDSDEGDKKKAAKDYSYSFDPAKLPPPPAEEEKPSKKAKAKKSKKEKAKKKSRRQSVASTDDESASDKENARKAKKRGSKKAAAAASSASVDLLGVDLDVQPAAQPPAAPQQPQPSIFDAPQSLNPLQDLAGLSFAAPVQAPVPTQPSVFDSSAPSEAQPQPDQRAGEAFRTNLLPENNLVDFNSLVSEKKKSLSANPEEKRTLNDLQKARGADQPTPVMAMSMQGQQQMQQQNMMQLHMSQLQITDGATGMQQQMYPSMQMPMQAGMSQPQMMMMQPQRGMMAQPQMINMQMMQQQFAQGSAAMVQPTQAQQGTNPKSADPFNQLP
jgi:hypothetical protein